MAKKKKPPNRLGAFTEHSLARLLYHCGFKGSEGDAKKFLAKCRRVAGKNGAMVINATNLRVSKKEMHGVPENKFSVTFFNGKAPTVLPL